LRIMSNYLFEQVTSLLQNTLSWRTRVFILGFLPFPYHGWVLSTRHVTLESGSQQVLPIRPMWPAARVQQGRHSR
jgi:hypothetical protein